MICEDKEIEILADEKEPMTRKHWNKLAKRVGTEFKSFNIWPNTKRLIVIGAADEDVSQVEYLDNLVRRDLDKKGILGVLKTTTGG